MQIENKADSRIAYPLFYRKYGLMFQSQLKTPKIGEYDVLTLPLNSLFHVVDYENHYGIGPSQDESIFNNVTKKASKVYIETVNEYKGTPLSGFIRQGKSLTAITTRYIIENERFLRSTGKVENYNSPMALPAIVYGNLDEVYEYKNIRIARLNKWLNYHRTVFAKALEVSRRTDRQQFLELQVPKRFPTITQIKKGLNGLDESSLKQLNNPDAWLISSFWNMILNNGNSYIFSDYTIHDFDKINIIWRFSNKFTIINVGRLLEFAYPKPINGKEQKPVMSPQRLNIKFVKLLLRLSRNEYQTEEEAKHEESIELIEMQEAEREISRFNHNQPSQPIDDNVEEYDDSNDEYEEREEDEDEEDNDNVFTGKRPLSKTDEAVIQHYTDIKLDKEIDDLLADIDEIDAELSEEDEEKQLDEELTRVSLDNDDDDSDDISAYKEYVPEPITPESVIKTDTDKLVKAGIMSVKEQNRYMKMAERSYELPNPLNPDYSIKTSTIVTKDDKEIGDNNRLPIESNDIVDESMLFSNLPKFNENYITNVYDKDIVRMVMNIQKGGIIVKDYQVETITTLHDNYQIHKVQIETTKGHVSTLTFKMPVLNEDGTFLISGKRRYSRRQRGDVPIRKVSPREVALTSYYSKMFVQRSERKQFNLVQHIQQHVINSSIDGLNDIHDIKFGDVFVNDVRLPRIYSTLSQKFTSFSCKGVTLHFNYYKISENFNGVKPDAKKFPVGEVDGKVKLWLTNEENSKLLDEKGTVIGTLEEFIGYDMKKAPLELAEVNIFGKSIPLVAILGYHLGLGNLMKTLKLKPRRVARKSRYDLAPDEYAIPFKDEVLIFNKKVNKGGLLIINGLMRYKDLVSSTSVYEFDKKSIYNDLFENIKAPLKQLKETKDMFNLWVDPITHDILEEMGEPTDLVMLFIRACELLTNDEHPDAMDLGYMRDKGYERFTGIMYSELTKVIREYNARPLYNNNKLTINPESIWYAITTDQSVEMAKDSSPVDNLKEKEVIIYSGAGGRSGQTMTAPNRKYHKSHIGTISEATVDSGDAGTTIYNSADPAYTSVYGLSKRVDPKTTKPARLLSTSGLLSPNAINDDTKRMGFISIQNGQTTFVTGASPMPYRTGMEKIISTRTSGIYSKIAPEAGKVIDVTKEYITVEYENGKKENFQIGRNFGTWGAYTMPHDLIPNVKKGDTFKKGHCLYYNGNYFQPDPTDNGNIIYKTHALARVAIVENLDVYEDSCVLSKEFSNKLYSKLTHIRNIRLNTNSTVRNLVKVGDKVETDSILCTLLASQTDTGLFGDDFMDSLQAIGSLNPKAQYKGTVDKIVVLYTAELDDMDEELQEIVIESDTRIFKETKKLGHGAKTGRINPGLNIEGKKLLDDEIVIQIYITEEADMTIADKVVVANQLKATVGRYWTEEQTTEDGKPFDLMFSAKSIDNRIVLSAEAMGTTNTLMVALTEQFIEAYEKK